MAAIGPICDAFHYLYQTYGHHVTDMIQRVM